MEGKKGKTTLNISRHLKEKNKSKAQFYGKRKKHHAVLHRGTLKLFKLQKDLRGAP